MTLTALKAPPTQDDGSGKGRGLVVEGLTVSFEKEDGIFKPVRDVSLSTTPGQTLCIVGESGCGKSLTSLAVMGLLPRAAKVTADRLSFNGADLLDISPRRLAQIRGDRISMIFQDPMSSLHPTFTIGNQMIEIMRQHRKVSRAQARERAVDLLERVGITAAGQRLGQYPHQLSGGLRQRVMIAMMLMCEPDLIVADEPTTALDVTIQAQILALLKDLQKQFGLTLVLITHDMGIVARTADEVAVMYAGQVVERGTASQVISAPLHPYTRALMDCLPVPGTQPRGTHLGSIPATVQQIYGDPKACLFANRCAHAHAACRAGPVGETSPGEGRSWRCVLDPKALPSRRAAAAIATDARETASGEVGENVMELRGVDQTFWVRRGLFGEARRLAAVSDVSLELKRGEVLGLVGESGCGKSTLARLLLGLNRPDAGDVLLDGKSIAQADQRVIARRIQPIFQDPYSSLNPRKTVGEIVSLPLSVHKVGDRREWKGKVEEQLERVGLPGRFIHSYPNQLSGGQRQRVSIARALIMRPEIVVCDEPTSALDVSVQAQIINLLIDLQKEFTLSYIFISHNLAVVEHLANRVAVMYLGRIVELTDTATLFDRPRHPYSQALLKSVLTPEPGRGIPESTVGAGFPNPLDPPSGCAFHPRCPFAVDRCRRERPALQTDATGAVACHRAGDPELAMARTSDH